MPRARKVKPKSPKSPKSPKAPKPKRTSAQDKARDRRLRQIFNITSEEYEKVLTHQGGVCAITQQPSNTLYVDHRHDSGLITGILSYKVNKGLAYFNDDPALLERAAEYLRKPPAVEALGEAVYGVIGRVTKKARNRKYGPDGTKTPQPRAALKTIKEITAS